MSDARRKTSPGWTGCWPRTRTGTWTSRHGSASSGGSHTARGSLFLRWPDRILFGVDWARTPAIYALHYRFLETLDESFPYDADEDSPPSQGRWAIHGLGLPDDVLRQVYRENARRLIRFD